MAACRYCGNEGLNNAQHVFGERKCCPDCDHRTELEVELHRALMSVEPNGGNLIGREVEAVLPVVRSYAAKALQGEADELREVALRGGDNPQWNAHRVWQWLSDRADRLRPCDNCRGDQANCDCDES